MTKIITIPDLEKLIACHGMKPFINDLISYLKEDFSSWNDFHKMPRVAAHSEHGIVELMPIWDKERFSYKYVNGHPLNPRSGHLTVVALGMLSSMKNGYPLLLSEMTVLTAIRTAATSAMASDLLANPHVDTLTLIGTGAQSEFQTLAHLCIRPLSKIRYFDRDRQAMERFKKNMEGLGLELIACSSVQEAVEASQLITVSTAAEGHNIVLPDNLVKPGMHINGIGGDSPGKTELDVATLKRAKIVVEFIPQSSVEGEIQRLTPQERTQYIRGELWEIVTAQKKGRQSPKEITVYDSVGFALEDYSILRLVHELSDQYKIGTHLPLIPELANPKDLISLLGGHHRW